MAKTDGDKSESQKEEVSVIHLCIGGRVPLFVIAVFPS